MRVKRSSGLTPQETRAVARTVEDLADLAPGQDPALILDAISGCVPVAAGLLMVINPEAPGAVSGAPLRLPLPIVEAWMRTPREHMKRAFVPVIKAAPGDFWRSESLAASVQEQLAVLAFLEHHGLGEGAGYKILTRPAPGRGTEHVVLALLTARGVRFSKRAPALLAAIAPAVEAAILRLEVPIVAAQRALSHLCATEGVGVIAIDGGGAVHEINRRALDLALLYAKVAGAGAKVGRLERFVARARAEVTPGSAWILRRGRAVLEVRRHPLRAEPRDPAPALELITLRESTLASRLALPDGVTLTRRRLEVAELLVSSGFSYKAIGARLRIQPGTVRAIVAWIYRAFGVESRDELVSMLLDR